MPAPPAPLLPRRARRWGLFIGVVPGRSRSPAVWVGGRREREREKERVRWWGEAAGKRAGSAPAQRRRGCVLGGCGAGAGGPSSPGGAPYGNDPALLAVPLALSLTERRKRGRGKRKKKKNEKRQRGGGELGDDEEESPGARELPGPGRGGGPRSLPIWAMVDSVGGNAKAPLPSAGNGTQRDLATPLFSSPCPV